MHVLNLERRYSLLKSALLIGLAISVTFLSRGLSAQEIKASVESDAERLVSIYKQVHANPELPGSPAPKYGSSEIHAFDCALPKLRLQWDHSKGVKYLPCRL